MNVILGNEVRSSRSDFLWDEGVRPVFSDVQ